MTIDPGHSHTFIYSIGVCIDLPTFISQAAIVSEEIIVFNFSSRKASENMTLPQKMVKVNPGPSFEHTIKVSSPQCYKPSSLEIGLTPKKTFKGFLPCVGVTAILVI